MTPYEPIIELAANEAAIQAHETDGWFDFEEARAKLCPCFFVQGADKPLNQIIKRLKGWAPLHHEDLFDDPKFVIAARVALAPQASCSVFLSEFDCHIIHHVFGHCDSILLSLDEEWHKAIFWQAGLVYLLIIYIFRESTLLASVREDNDAHWVRHQRDPI